MGKRKKNTGSAGGLREADSNALRAEKPVAAKREHKLPEEEDSRASWLAGAWVMLMFALFPLIFTDHYFNILQTKDVTFIVLALLLAVGMGIVYLDGGRKFRPLGSREDLNRADLSVLAFFGIALIATLLSGKFMYQALTGIDGRFVGLFYIALITASYFIVSRNLCFSQKYLTVFLAVGLPVCLLGYTDFYNMDLLGFRTEMLPEQYAMFMSTFGNVNTYTTYVGLVVGVSGALFTLSEEKTGRLVFYYLVYLVAMLALITGASDNGYLSLAGLFGALPFVAFRSRKGRARYLLLFATMLLVIDYLTGVSIAKAGKVIPLYGLFLVIGKLPGLPLIGAVLGVLAVVLLYREKGKEAVRSPHATLWLRGYAVLLILAVLALIGLFVYANSLPYETVHAKFGMLGDYLKFRNEWGTFRGYVWRATLDEYSKLPILNRIFGSGPDTYVGYMVTNRWNEMNQITGQFYDAAHNEYLQYLFTVGPFGLLAHLGILVFSVRAAFSKARALRERQDGSLPRVYSAYLYALGIAVICYAFQAFVNINVPVAAPVLWALLAVARAAE